MSVRSQLAGEFLGTAELAYVAQTVDELHGEAMSIEVRLPVNEVYLKGTFLSAEGGTRTQVGYPGERPGNRATVVVKHPDGIDTISWKQLVCRSC